MTQTSVKQNISKLHFMHKVMISRLNATFTAKTLRIAYIIRCTKGQLFDCPVVGGEARFKCTLQGVADYTTFACIRSAFVYDGVADCTDGTDERE